MPLRSSYCSGGAVNARKRRNEISVVDLPILLGSVDCLPFGFGMALLAVGWAFRIILLADHHGRRFNRGINQQIMVTSERDSFGQYPSTPNQ